MKNLPRIKEWFSFNERAITLTELVVASAMIGIVMVGVASFGSSISQLQSSTSRSVILGMRAKSVLARISDDAFATIGDNEDLGYRWRMQGPNSRSICFRHDVASTPSDYTDDTWTCYWRDNDDILFLCGPNPTVSPNTPGNAVQCDGTGSRRRLLELRQRNFFNVVRQPIVAGDFNRRLDYFEFEIFTLFDPSLTENPITNPRYDVTAQISPPAQSR